MLFGGDLLLRRAKTGAGSSSGIPQPGILRSGINRVGDHRILLSGAARNLRQPNGRSVYESDQGDIEVTKIDNVIYFSVPAGGGNILNVEAKVSKKQVVIQRWQLEKE